MKKMLILGCGWIGETFAHLQLENNWQVWATTTSEEKYHRLINDGIFAYRHDFDQSYELDTTDWPHFDLVITSIPATQKNAIELLDFRFYQVENLLKTLNYGQHIFFSSVGIYPDFSEIFEEDYAEVDLMNPKLKLAEDRVKFLANTSIFRLGGLFGKNRVFAKYFEDRIVTTGDQPANFIHLDDVCGILFEWIRHREPTSGIFNVVAPEHPLKKEVIYSSSKRHGFRLPAGFDPQNSFQKIISNNKITQLLNYRFIYPSPLDF